MQPNPPAGAHQELRELYRVSAELCRQQARAQLNDSPNDLVLIQIVAACESVLQNFEESNKLYLRCLEIEPEGLAYLNNLAWNYISTRDNDRLPEAVAFLNDAKQKWHHPKIQRNLALAYERGGIQNQEMIDQIFERVENYRPLYPDFQQVILNNPHIQEGRQELYNGLINTFLLPVQRNYGQNITRFRNNLQELVQRINDFNRNEANVRRENLPVIFNEMRKFMVRIRARRTQQEESGMVIQNRLDTWMRGIEKFVEIIPGRDIYGGQRNERIERLELDAVRTLINNVFDNRVQHDNFDRLGLINEVIVPYNAQLEEYRDRINEILNERRADDRQVEPVEPQANLIPVENVRPVWIRLDQEPVQKPYVIIPIDDGPVVIDVDRPQQIPNNEIIQHQNIQQPQERPVQQRHDQFREPEQVQPGPVVLQEDNRQQDINPPINNPVIPVPQSSENEDIRRKDSEELRQSRLNRDRQICSQQKPREDRFQRDQLKSLQFQFTARHQDIQQLLEQNSEHIEQTLRISKQHQATPLILIVKYRTKQGQQLTKVYLNHIRVNAHITRIPNLSGLDRISDQKKKTEILSYYYVLNILLKFYHYYGDSNFEYKRKGVESNIEFSHYIDLITPALNSMFDGHELLGSKNIGYLINQIHYSLAKYITEIVPKGQYLKFTNRILKNIHKIYHQYHQHDHDHHRSPAEALFVDLLDQSSLKYINILLSHNMQKINGSTLPHQYFHWKINRHHLLTRDQEVCDSFTEEDNWIISNVCLLIITLGQEEFGKFVENDNNMLADALIECFMERHDKHNFREKIIRKYYESNHQIKVKDKIIDGVKTVLKKLLPI